jgi:hypothetical protein
MNLTAIVDRIEEDIAVLEIEGETSVDFPVQFLPSPLKEGDTLLLTVSKQKE